MLITITARTQMGSYKLAYCLGAGTPEVLEDVFQADPYMYMEDLKRIASRRLGKCIQNGANSSRGPSVAGIGMEGTVVCGCSGLCSALKVFTALVDGLWIMYNHMVDVAIHYLNDYLMVGDPLTRECAQALQCTLSLCELLGIPVSKAKVEGPTMILVFLGILLDAIKLEL